MEKRVTMEEMMESLNIDYYYDMLQVLHRIGMLSMQDNRYKLTEQGNEANADGLWPVERIKDLLE